MQIGKPLREIEIIPSVEPVPMPLPVEQPRRKDLPEPAPAAPTREPAEAPA